MKYLKKFEDIENTPEIGDYIIPNVETLNHLIDNKINNHVYQIIGTKERNMGGFLYIIKVKLNDNQLDDWYLSNYEIMHLSKNKEDLEVLLQSNKFNI